MFDYYKPHDEDHLDSNEMAFYKVLMAHRASLGLSSIPLSASLTTTASRHVLDLMYNGQQPGSRHSWSDMTYDPNNINTYGSMTAAPQRVGTLYSGAGYEILLSSEPGTIMSQGSPQSELSIFLSSAPHRSVIENLGGWKDLNFNSIGISIRGAYLSVWFGVEADPAGAPLYVEQDTPISIATPEMGGQRYGGSGLNDIFLANDAAAAFDATGGYDIFVAGAGTALAHFRGKPSEYLITQEGGTLLVQDSVAGRDGTVRLVSFRSSDNLLFDSDGTYELKTIGSVVPGADSLLKYSPVAGGSGADLILGTAGNDFIALGNGADTYRFGGGQDIFAGGAGWDVIQFAKPISAYQLASGRQGYTVTGEEGTVSFTDVEVLIFADRVHSISKPAWFNEEFYIANNPDIAAALARGALATGYQHWQQYGVHEPRKFTTWFDADYYLSRNPDVAAAVKNGWISAWGHYQAFGWREGRDPSPLFDTSAYLDANPDVRAAGVNPLDHWLGYGWGEGRPAAPTNDYLAWG